MKISLLKAAYKKICFMNSYSLHAICLKARPCSVDVSLDHQVIAPNCNLQLRSSHSGLMLACTEKMMYNKLSCTWKACQKLWGLVKMFDSKWVILQGGKTRTEWVLHFQLRCRGCSDTFMQQQAAGPCHCSCIRCTLFSLEHEATLMI